MSKVTIIAELGLNPDGDYGKAIQMINAVKQTGVTIVKFQHYNPLQLLGPLSPYLAYATKCQFTKQQHQDLKTYCDVLGLEYLVSVFDRADIQWANVLCKRHKVASRMNQDEEFVSMLMSTDKQVIVSTQSHTPRQVEGLDYMFCIPEYPTPLSKMEHLPCGPNLGLSSHCPSIQPSLKAVAQGAGFIEHHVKFSGDNDGCDKSSSIDFDQLKQLQRFCNELNVIS